MLESRRTFHQPLDDSYAGRWQGAQQQDQLRLYPSNFRDPGSPARCTIYWRSILTRNSHVSLLVSTEVVGEVLYKMGFRKQPKSSIFFFFGSIQGCAVSAVPCPASRVLVKILADLHRGAVVPLDCQTRLPHTAAAARASALPKVPTPIATYLERSFEQASSTLHFAHPTSPAIRLY